jgi:hypothetical protein
MVRTAVREFLIVRLRSIALAAHYHINMLLIPSRLNQENPLDRGVSGN